MKCPEVRQRIYLFLDNELEVQENLEILAHLDFCTDCKERFESEKQLEEIYRNQFSAESDQSELWRKIRSQIGFSRKILFWASPIKRKLLIWTPAIAATFIIVLGTLFYYFSAPAKLNAETLVNQSIDLHRQMEQGKLPLQFSKDLNQNFKTKINALIQKAGFDIRSPDLSKLGYTPRGASITTCPHARQEQVATTFYVRGPRHLSYMILKDPQIPLPQNWERKIHGIRNRYYIQVVRPYKVIIIRKGPNLYIFVGSINHKQLDDLIDLLLTETMLK